MTGDNLVRRAAEFAMQAHQRIDHRRKYSGQPYEVHLKQVARLIAEAGGTEATQAAAWLHDLVEDTPVTLGDIRREFGEEIAELVNQLTDVSRPGDGNRAQRKAIDRAHLAVASPQAKTVKLADLIDNARDICPNDPRFAPVYLQEMARLLPVLDGGSPVLYRRAWSLWRREAERYAVSGAVADGAATAEESSILSRRAAFGRFGGLFSAADIAEPALTFDAGSSPAAVARVMASHGHPMAIACRDGRPAGVIVVDDLAAPAASLTVRPFREGQVLPGTASVADVAEVLTRQDACFVESYGNVSGILTRADMQKPYVRMWLFGIITLIEMVMNERIERRFPNDSWAPLLTGGRLDKANQLRDERLRLGQPCSLLDCLQMGDKTAILLNDPDFPKVFAFPTRSAAKAGMNELQSLRNHLAHNQDIVTGHWSQIARLAREISAR